MIIENSILLDENFNDGFPSEWEIINGGTSSDSWKWITDRSNNSLDGTPFMIVDSDEVMSAYFQEGLLTPAINIPSPDGQLILTFDHFYNHLNSFARIDVFDGNVWIEGIKSFSIDDGVWSNPARVEIDITSYANDELKIRFYYDDNNRWAWWWAVDNVKIEVVPVYIAP